MSGLVLVIAPELTNVNGDAENALVLVRRAEWCGESLTRGALSAGERAPQGRPAAVVLGGTTDPALPALLDVLRPLRQAVDGWIRTGVPILAVGTGLEALCRRIELPDGPLEGLGVVAADVLPLEVRVADDLVVDAPEGRLVGYENHARGLRLDPGVLPLGTVARGVGDGRGVDGVRAGSVYGTRMHGPVLAKNPVLADAILARMLEHPVTMTDPAAAFADAQAAAARDVVLSALVR